MSTSLIIGASGQVGEHLLRLSRRAGAEAVGTYCAHPAPGMPRLDLREPAEVRAVVKSLAPSVVYLPASLTHVDYCELHPEETYEINVSGVQNVIEAANDAGARLVYFSSDYVFDGRSGPYSEDDAPSPISEYGRQKLAAENLISAQVRDHLIVRTNVVFGWERQGKNFVFRLLNSLKAGDVVTVPADQISSPTYAPDLARAVVELSLSGAAGIYHVAGTERASRYEFACEAARAFGFVTDLIRPVTTAALGQPAARPLNAGMVVDKASARLKTPLMSYREGLKAMAAEKRAAG
jgi:dTDP-4-dehydrorhamnose reductase